MSEKSLVPQVPGGDGQPSVDQFIISGRMIHERFSIKKPYSQWIQKNIDSLGLIVVKDFITYQVTNSKRGRPSYDHIFTAEAADRLGLLMTRTKKDAQKKIVRQKYMTKEAAERMFDSFTKTLPLLIAETVKALLPYLQQSRPQEQITLPTETKRMLLRERINSYVRIRWNEHAMDKNYSECWILLWQKAYVRLGIRFPKGTKDRFGHVENTLQRMDELYALACELFPLDPSSS